MNNTPQWAVECFCGGTVTLRAYTCEPVTLSPVSLCKFDMTNTVEIRRQIVVTPINIALTVAASKCSSSGQHPTSTELTGD